MSPETAAAQARAFEIDAPWLPRRAAATPSTSALSWPGRESSICYAELLARAEAAARALRLCGVEPGDVVAVRLASGPVYAVLVHALQLCGAVLLPINLRLLAAELVPQLALARPRLWLHAPADALALDVAKHAALATAAVESAADGRLEIVATAPAPSATPLCTQLEAESPAALLFTSGTTGDPKAAVLSLRAFQASARASAQLLGVQTPRDGGDASAPEAGDEWLACMPLYHVGGLSILARSVLGGTSVRIHPGFDVAAVVADLEAGRVSQISLVATMLQRLIEARGDDPSPPRLRTVLLGGGPCAASLLERAVELGYPIAPTYGLTEACSQVATRLPSNRGRPLHAGLRALPGVELRVVDRDGEALGSGEAGEIEVRGDILMSGYLVGNSRVGNSRTGNSRTGSTREANAGARPATRVSGLRMRSPFRNGWLCTGDIGRLDSSGGLEVLDRRDDLIVSGGENVVPAEVESVLQAHPAVLDAGVVARADREFGARPVAFVVLRDDATCTPPALIAFCRAHLAGYKVPVEVVVRSELPRTAAGKLQRARLRALL